MGGSHLVGVARAPPLSAKRPGELVWMFRGYRGVGGGCVHSSSTGKEGDSTEVNYTGVTNHVETRGHKVLWSLTNLTTRCSVYEATLIAAHRTECFDNWRVISSREEELPAHSGSGLDLGKS